MIIAGNLYCFIRCLQVKESSSIDLVAAYTTRGFLPSMPVSCVLVHGVVQHSSRDPGRTLRARYVTIEIERQTPIMLLMRLQVW